jgi:hypothetical protein
MDAKNVIGRMPLRIGGPHISFDSFTDQRAIPNDVKEIQIIFCIGLQQGHVKLILSAWPDIPSNPKQLRVVRSCGG